MGLFFGGIASGDATYNSGVFWARTQNSNSDTSGVVADITLEISETADFKTLAYAGTAKTLADNNFAAKIDVTILKPGTFYYYRWKGKDGSTDVVSATGQFQTAIPASSSDTFRFFHTGDADGLMAPYLASQDLAREKFNLGIWNGDVIYETASKLSAATPATKDAASGAITQATLLAAYRAKYTEARQPIVTGGFESLDTLYSAAGQYTTYDNHELGNAQMINGGAPASLATSSGKGTSNTALDVNTSGSFINQTETFKTLQKAFLESQPIRDPETVIAPSDPRSNGTPKLYDAQQWGKNSLVLNLDTRSYRDVRLTKADGSDDTGTRADNANRTLLGVTQLEWLKSQLKTAQDNGVIWKFINITDPIDQLGAVGSGDDGGKSWMGGYRAERNNLLKYIADNKISNVVFMACDDHQGRINEVLYVPDPINNPNTYKPVPGSISIVTGPIGATGPDVNTDHSFTAIQKLANDLAAKQTTAGVNPIGLDPNFVGLYNIRRQGDGSAATNPSPVDFYSPDTFSYGSFEVTPEGVLNFALRGIPSYAKDSQPTPSAANQPQDILSFSIDGLAAQRAISGDPDPLQLKPLSGSNLASKPIYSYGLNPQVILSGIPDGLGAFRLDNNTIRVGVNSEIGKDAGSTYSLNNGTQLTGARINYIDLNNAGQVKGGRVGIQSIVDRFGSPVTDASQISGDIGTLNGFTRFCAANLAEANAFGTGKGFVDRILLVGEESAAVQKGLGGTMCALDVSTGTLYQLADLGYGSWETSTIVDTGDSNKIAIFLGDDSTPSFAMMYVGTKSTAANASFLERNGLVGGDMYVWVANDGTAHDRPNEVAGTGTTVDGKWVKLAIKDPTKASTDPTTGYDKLGYLGISKVHDAALAINALAFARIEDQDYNHTPGKGNQVIFNATGQSSNPSYADLYGTTFTIDTTFTNGLPGAAKLKTVYDGDDVGNQQNGIRSQDNLVWSADGSVYVLEDRAISNDAAWGSQEGSVWKLNPDTGKAQRMLQIDRSAVPVGMTDSLAKGVIDSKGNVTESASGQWETSGIIDVSSLYGHAPGTDYFLDVQAHGLQDGAIKTNRIVEGGQIVGFNKSNGLNAPTQLKATGSTTQFNVTPLFTFGDSVGAFTPVGIPDGEGAYLKDAKTIRLLVNAEIGKDKGYSYMLANGTEMTGARIQYFDLDITTNQVKNAGLAYSKVVDRFGSVVTDPSQISGVTTPGSSIGFDRFCSANLFEKDTFGAGLGFKDRVFLMGEESSSVRNGLGGSLCALDVDNGVLYQLSDMGYGSWEGATLVDTGDKNKVGIFLGDDSTPSFAMLYVGTKSTDPNAGFLERNGLVGGKMYVWAANDSSKKDPLTINGTGTTLPGSWVELKIRDASKASTDPTTGYDSQGFLGIKKMHDAATALNAAAFARIEDEDYNHAAGKGNQVAFNATGQTSNASYKDVYGTTYTIDTTFSNGLPSSASLKVIYDGDDAGKQQTGVRSQDNIAWSADGFIYLNEDRAIGTAGNAADDATWGTQEGSVWKLDPTTGKAERVLQIDRSALPTDPVSGKKQADTFSGKIGEWETSGVIDVSTLYGHAAGTDFFTVVQAHGLQDGPISANGLVEGGQILKFSNSKVSSSNPADTSIKLGGDNYSNRSLTELTSTKALTTDSQKLLDRYKINQADGSSAKASDNSSKFIDFTIKTTNTSTVVTEIALQQQVKANSYLKINPNTGEAFDFTYNPTTGLGAKLLDTDNNGLVDTIKVYLKDGALGDADGVVNGEIRDPGIVSEAPTGDVYRFYRNGVHFFTIDQNERDSLIKGSYGGGVTYASLKANPNAFDPITGGFKYEGTSGKGFEKGTAGSALHRFYNPLNGDHLLTADGGEANALIKNGLGYIYEGITHNVSTISQLGMDKANYRFYNAITGDHMITADINEANAIITASIGGSFVNKFDEALKQSPFSGGGGYQYEGIAFYSAS